MALKPKANRNDPLPAGSLINPERPTNRNTTEHAVRLQATERRLNRNWAALLMFGISLVIDDRGEDSGFCHTRC
jgi:hypothetical protein